MTMNTKQQIAHDAFAAQDTLNSRLSPDWASKGWRYYRAIFRETVEILDHLNWEWYKVPVVDALPDAAQIQQIKLEMCDILHFGLSQMMIDCGPDYRQRLPQLAREFTEYFDQGFASRLPLTGDFGELVEDYATLITMARTFIVYDFARLCWHLRMDFAELLGYYYAKQTLNKFRWSNGYALPKGHPDKYVKLWGDTKTEDNVHLMRIHNELVSSLDGDSERLAAALASGDYGREMYQRLSAAYPGKLHSIPENI